jgi:PAS domain S-box-containing protein
LQASHVTNPFRRSTLVGKLLRFILPVVFVSLCGVTISCYLVARAQIRKGISGQVQRLAEQVAAHVRVFHEQRRIDLETIAESRILFDYHRWLDLDLEREADDERGKLNEYFLEFSRRVGVYDLVAYASLDGEIVAAVEKGAIYRAPHHPEIETTSLAWDERPYYASPILPQDGRKHITFARPYRDSEGAIRGTIFLVCDAENLLSVLEDTGQGLGQRGGACLRDDLTGLTIGRVPPERSPLRAEVAVAELGGRVIVEADEQEFIQPLRILHNVTILLSVAVTGAVMGLLILQLRRATRPIQDMVRGTQRLAAGDLDYRFPLPPLQDLQNLAVAFNGMAANLKARSEALENRIGQLSALRLMEQTVIQGLDEESILRTTLGAVARGLGFDRAGLYWVDEESGVVAGRYSHFNYSTRFTEADFRKRRLPLGGDDILNKVIATRQAQLVSDPSHHEGVDMRYVREAGSREFVMAPLCGQDHVYGVITADNCHTQRPLRESDREGLMLFASAAGMALENARLMKRIAESEARHRMVLDNSPVAILGLSRHHRIVTWNRGAESIFGCRAEEVVGRSIRDLVAPAAGEDFEQLLSSLMRDGAVRDVPLKARRSDGALLDVAVSWSGSSTDFLANDEWTVVIRDVTEARKLQNQLILSEKLTVVGQLIAGIAHELNNPLQAVVGYAQVLVESPQHGADRELRSVYENAKRCRRIIDNLLLFVRQGEVHKRSIPLRRVVDASLELLSHKLRRGQIAVGVHGDDELYVHANFQQLEQVFINLLNNACDALAGCTGPRRIDIDLMPDDGHVSVRIGDTGPGIPPQIRDRIFEPFFTTKGEGLGTGLGLPLCRQIIEDHGGSLRVRDGEAGMGGTVFHFELKRCPHTDSEQAETAPPVCRVAGRRIFVVDDEPEVRSLLQDVLEAQGHQVTSAESLQAAFAAARSDRFDLVVSDVHLNDGTGLDLLHQWNACAGYPRPPFLFLTGDLVSPSLEAVCAEAHARVLQKPMDLREFRAAVAWALDGAVGDRRAVAAHAVGQSA